MKEYNTLAAELSNLNFPNFKGCTFYLFLLNILPYNPYYRTFSNVIERIEIQSIKFVICGWKVDLIILHIIKNNVRIGCIIAEIVIV